MTETPTMTLHYTDPATGEKVSTGPFTRADLDRAHAELQGKGAKSITAMELKAMKAKDTGNAEMFSEHETGPSVAAGPLRAFIERVERLEEEKQTIAEDIREIYAEMKGTGFDTKAVRSIVKLRKKDQAERQEEEAILELYKAALGMS